MSPFSGASRIGVQTAWPSAAVESANFACIDPITAMSTVSPPRVVAYLLSQALLDRLPSCFPHLTAINVGAFQIGFDRHRDPFIHLNGVDPARQPPELWSTLKAAQRAGVKVLASLGGADGGFKPLFEYYEMFYPAWCDLLREYGFDGLDLAIEEPVTPSNLAMFISDVRRDLPPGFLLTAAPVASALSNGYDPFAGLDWRPFAAQLDWFNVQFFNGWGTLATTTNYRAVVAAGYHPTQIVAGSLTNPANGGTGYVPISPLGQTLRILQYQFPGQFGGVAGWEFSNAHTLGETVDPRGWCAAMAAAIQRPVSEVLA